MFIRAQYSTNGNMQATGLGLPGRRIASGATCDAEGHMAKRKAASLPARRSLVVEEQAVFSSLLVRALRCCCRPGRPSRLVSPGGPCHAPGSP